MKEPKQKAEELIGKHEKLLKNNVEYTHFGTGHSEVKNFEYLAKQCALICLEEIIKSNPTKPYGVNNTQGYWQEVKKHLE